MIMNGYKTQTTFWEDFTIADAFGDDAVHSTFRTAFRYWKDDAVYLTELVMVLNWKCWQHYEKGNTMLSSLYSNLFYDATDYAYDHLEGDDLKYFMNTTNG